MRCDKNSFQSILISTVSGKNLSFAEASIIAKEITNGEQPSSKIAAMLTALKMKGETTEEIAGFAKTFRRQMISINCRNETIDVCGTGGDGKKTFNISTATAFIVAASGIPVAKHGNRAITSSCGSADVLEALGVNINLSPSQAENILYQTGITFLFAPKFHHAMKKVAPIRKQLGFTTIFNYLGPLLNPARVKTQLIGTITPKIAKKLAYALKSLGIKKAIVLSSTDGMDEVSLNTPTVVYWLKRGNITENIINPKDYGFTKTSSKRLKGGNAQENAKIIRLILSGKERGPRKEIVLLNSALTISMAREIKMAEAIKQAQKVMDSGNGFKILQQLILRSHEKK